MLKKKKTLVFFCLNSNITKGRNIHLCLENPDGPWTHSILKEVLSGKLNQQKIIINLRRDKRVELKIEDILDQLITSAVEKDRGNDSGDEDKDGDEETGSEVEDDEGTESEVEDEKAAQDLSARSCQFCNKLFLKKGNKDHHENCVHKRNPMFKSAHFCKLVDPGCEKVFSSKRSLRYHQLKAHGKAVSCEKCSKEFTDFKEFVKHRRSERGNPKIPVVVECSICKIPISSQHLKRHKSEVHQMPTKNPLKEPAQKHNCPHCSKQFKRVEKMQRHIKEAHSLVIKENWKCGQCEKSFTLERNLKLHIERVHAHFPFFSTFNCNQCGKFFKLKGNLKRHQKEQHGDGEMFSCPSCRKCFERKSNQERHSKNCKELTE